MNNFDPAGLDRIIVTLTISLLLSTILAGMVVVNTDADTEPNDDFVSAEAVTPGTYAGNLGVDDNADFYALELGDAGETVYVNVTVGSDVEIFLYLYDQYQGDKDSDWYVSGGVARVDWCFETAQTVYVKVERSSGEGYYDMEIAVASQNDVGSGGDAGNDFASALPVSPGAYSGNFLKDEDRYDYYRLELGDAGETVYVNVTVGSDVEIFLYLYDQYQGDRDSDWYVSGGVARVDWCFETAQTVYVKVERSSGEGHYDMQVDVLEGLSGETPSEPLNVSSVSGDCVVRLSWSPPALHASSVTGYEIYRSEAGIEETLLTRIGNVTEYADTTVVNGRTYTYRVRATTAFGNGDYSSPVEATPTVISVPGAPVNLLVAVGNGKATLVWSPPKNDGGAAIAGYNIYFGKTPGELELLLSVGNATRFTHNGLTNDIVYLYRVNAFNAAGEGAGTNETPVVPSDKLPPNAPGNVTAAGGDGQVTLTWEPPTYDGGKPILKYRIYRTTAKCESVLSWDSETIIDSTSGISTDLSVMETVGNVLGYVDTDVRNAVRYYYHVTAVNEVGEGTVSNTTAATPTEAESLNDWQPCDSAPPLSNRAGHAMAWCPGGFVVFGGRSEDGVLGDTWYYDADTDSWTAPALGVSPSPRTDHAMTFDRNSGKFVLFGGRQGNTYLSDTWLYDPLLCTWERSFPSSSPPARAEHAMVYDPANGRIILFGGSGGGTYYHDTWAYDVGTNAWTLLNPASSPPAREGHCMVYDNASGEIVLFGGQQESVYFSDTWLYIPSLNTWMNRNPATHPSARTGHSMVYDAESRLVLLFGGFGGGYLSDTWAYDVDTNEWVSMNPRGVPSERVDHGMVYYPNTDTVTMFGGLRSWTEWRSYRTTRRVRYGFDYRTVYEYHSYPVTHTEYVDGIISYRLSSMDHMLTLPSSWSMTVGESRQFSALGYVGESGGKRVFPHWSVDGGGTITQQGMFEAKEVGEWTVTAEYMGLVSNAVIRVIEPVVQDNGDSGVEVKVGSYLDLPEGWIGMRIRWSNYTIWVKSNSSVLGVLFDKDARAITLQVSGSSGTTGVCVVVVPKAFMPTLTDLDVQVDGRPQEYALDQNDTHHVVTIEYTHSTHLLTTYLEGTSHPETQEANPYPLYWLIGGVTLLAVVAVVVLVMNRKGKE